MKKSFKLILGILFISTLIGYLGFQAPLAHCDQDDTFYVTGLPELTPEELEYQNKHMLRVKKIKINKLGLKRINAHRQARGLSPLIETEDQVPDIGQDIDGVVGSTVNDEQTDGSLPGELPSYVDNSALKYFPPIGNQGSLGSCGVFSGTYYAMTYMHALANDLDVKSAGMLYTLSPKWTYNMVNGGENVGTWYYWAYEIGQKHGCATMAEFPYVGSTSNSLYYREWSTDPVVWRNAIDRRFDQYGYVANTNEDSGINQVKLMLLNGYILNIPTYIYSWQYKAISDDPATTADDAFVGKSCAYWVNGTSGYHAMTVVGYNDDIWVDINSNGIVDSGEKGAFRIANSWGTGWGEGGFRWMAYDALKNPSAVPGAPGSGRITGWSPARAHWVTARTDYQPTLVAEFTLNHQMRNQLRITLGISDVFQSTPQTLWYPKMISLQGGGYAFDGSTTAMDGTFVFDFTDIAPSVGQEMRYYIGVYDSSLGDQATLSSFTLLDEFNWDSTTSYDVPIIVDQGQAYAALGYYYSDGNIPPLADFAADPVSGEAPLAVNFTDYSTDEDGSIISYAWDFGDGDTSSSQHPAHTYTRAGEYVATLTVTDNNGARDSARMVISVSAPPLRAAYVSNIDLSLAYTGINVNAQALVQISDDNGDPVPNVTVTGDWSGGLVNGTTSALTGTDGTATLISPKTKKDGIFTITITDLSAAAYYYGPDLNNETSDSISTLDNGNQSPVAVAATTSQPSGPAPLTVHFSAANSYDPDGQIVTYYWDFGDGTASSGESASHTYLSAGTYLATLTITDNDGATDSDSLTILVYSDGNESVMWVGDIGLSLNNDMASAMILIMADSGPVAGASVTGEWSGLVSGTVSGLTDQNGTVTFFSRKNKKSGDFVFTATNVTRTGYTYDTSLNIETSVYITAP